MLIPFLFDSVCFRARRFAIAGRACISARNPLLSRRQCQRLVLSFVEFFSVIFSFSLACQWILATGDMCVCFEQDLSTELHTECFENFYLFYVFILF